MNIKKLAADLDAAEFQMNLLLDFWVSKKNRPDFEKYYKTVARYMDTSYRLHNELVMHLNALSDNTQDNPPPNYRTPKSNDYDGVSPNKRPIYYQYPI
jgi:hypothetical protein